MIRDTVCEELPTGSNQRIFAEHGKLMCIERKYLNSAIGTLLNVLLKKLMLKLRMSHQMSQSIKLYNQLVIISFLTKL